MAKGHQQKNARLGHISWTTSPTMTCRKCWRVLTDGILCTKKGGKTWGQRLFICIFAAIIINKLSHIAYLCQIGDSPIFYRIDEEDVNILSSEKEFLNETDCIGPSSHPSFSVVEKKISKRIDFLIATDGFGDEVVHEAAGSLFDYFKIKYSKLREKKRNSALKIELKEAMQDKNNDDKSIIFGWTCQ